VREQFLRVENRAALIVESDVAALLDHLESELGVLARLQGDGADHVVPNTRSPASPRPGRM